MEDVARKTVAAQKEAANSRQRPKGAAGLPQCCGVVARFGTGKLTADTVETMLFFVKWVLYVFMVLTRKHEVF